MSLDKQQSLKLRGFKLLVRSSSLHIKKEGSVREGKDKCPSLIENQLPVQPVPRQRRSMAADMSNNLIDVCLYKEVLHSRV